MQVSFLSIVVFVAAIAAPHSSARAQLSDQISSIGGENFLSNTQIRYFNQAWCAAPEEAFFELQLDRSGSPSPSVYLWLGRNNAQCHLAANRNPASGLCAEIAGNPRSVGVGSQVSGATLEDLLDASAGVSQVASCESPELGGAPYEIFLFRDQGPGSTDVSEESFGVAGFMIDVEPPLAPRVDTSPQEGTAVVISWSEPDPPDDIGLWAFYSSSESDPGNAQPLGITALPIARSQTISAAQLGITIGETAYVFVSAVDQAFVSDELSGNESPLSDPVAFTFMDTGDAGVDAGMGGGMDAGTEISHGGRCAASPVSASTPATWALGLLALALSRRRPRASGLRAATTRSTSGFALRS